MSFVIVESPLGAFVILLGFVVFFHVILIVWRPLSAVGWKTVDYWWLSFAALGLIAAAGEVRRLRSPFGIDVARARAGVALWLVRMSADPQMHCLVFTRTDVSPPDLDSVQAEQDRFCAWVRQIANETPDSLVSSSTATALDSIPEPPELKDPGLVRDAKAILARIANLYDANQTWISAEGRAKRYGLETTMVVLSPWLIALALGLRITKVTGELRLLKRSSS